MPSPQPSPNPLRIVIAGGGTGGHVIPALAIGRELRDQHNAELLYIGTSRGLETKLVPEAGFTLKLVRSGQLKNVSLKTRLKTFADLPQGVLQCLQHLRTFHPQVVVGVGGYASGPAILAAAILRIPTLAYEPNAVPGMTNRIAGRFTSAAAVNFPQTTQFFRNAEVTGVPVRPEIFEIPPRPVPQTSPGHPTDLAASPLQTSTLNNNSPLHTSTLSNNPSQPTTDETPLRLLVTAGSQGAAVFNDLLPKIAHRLLLALPNLTIVHQSGPRHLETTRAAYAQTGLLPPLGSSDDVCSRLATEPAARPSTDLPPRPSTDLSAEPVIDPPPGPSTDPSSEPVVDPPPGPFTDPSSEPVIDPPSGPSTDPSSEPSTDLPPKPSTNLSSRPEAPSAGAERPLNSAHAAETSPKPPQPPVTVEAFLNDMPAQYAAADLILARSGSTVAELCAAGRASLLIPFPQAADDHQRRNAEVLAEAGAAQMLLQADTTEHTLYQALLGLLTDHPRRAAMAANARGLARPGALERIAAMALRLAHQQSR